MCVCIVEAKISNRWSFIIYKFTSDFSTQHRQIENFSHINSLNNLIIRDDWIVAEEDKIWEKAWRAQRVHVHGPKEGRAHSLCGVPDKTKAQTCPPRFRFLKTCSARKGLGLQGQDLSYKEKTCPTRIRLALQGKDLGCKNKTCPTRKRLGLQGKEARPHYYKSPNILLTSRYV